MPAIVGRLAALALFVTASVPASAGPLAYPSLGGENVAAGGRASLAHATALGAPAGGGVPYVPRIQARFKYTSAYDLETETITLLQVFIKAMPDKQDVGVPAGAHVRLDCLRGCTRRDAWTTRLSAATRESVVFRGIVVKPGAQILVTIRKPGWIGLYNRLTAIGRLDRSFISLRSCLSPSGPLKPRSCSMVAQELQRAKSGSIEKPKPPPRPRAGTYCGAFGASDEICLAIDLDFDREVSIYLDINSVPCADGNEAGWILDGLTAVLNSQYKFNIQERFDEDSTGDLAPSVWTVAGSFQPSGRASGTLRVIGTYGGVTCDTGTVNWTAQL